MTITPPKPEQQPEFDGYKLPRPPMFRLCTLGLRADHWPDRGTGVWIIEGYDNMDKRDEVYLLRQVMPGTETGTTGGRIRFWRNGHDTGHLTVWRKGEDLVDPKYSPAADPSGSMSAAGASALPGEALSEAQILHEARACGAPPPVAPWHTKYVNGIPQFNPTAECSPTLTQCPRCNNPHHACDRGAPQQTEWLAEAERLADAYAQQSWINGCNGSAAGMTTGPESEARAALLSHLGKRSEPPGK